jgi:hypothetical protein
MTQRNERLEDETAVNNFENQPGINTVIILFYNCVRSVNSLETSSRHAKACIIEEKARFFRENKEFNFVQKAHIIKVKLLEQVQDRVDKMDEQVALVQGDINIVRATIDLIIGVLGIKFDPECLQNTEDNINRCQLHLATALKENKIYPDECSLFVKPLYQSLYPLIESIKIPE